MSVEQVNPEYLTDAPAIDGFQVEQKIGAGSYGTVWSGRQIASQNPVVIKVVKRINKDLPVVELCILTKYQHPNIVRLVQSDINVNLTSSSISVVLERATDSLLNYKKPINNVGPNLAGLTSALKFLSEQGVLYCDLKPDNILVFETDRGTLLKLADFGLVRYDQFSSAAYAFTSTYCPPEQFTVFADEEVNGLEYLHRPEPTFDDIAVSIVTAKRIIEPSAMIWTLGLVFYYIVTGEDLIKYIIDRQDTDDFTLIFAQIYENMYGPNPKLERKLHPVNSQMADLIVRMTRLNPADRLTLDQVLSHPALGNNPVLQGLLYDTMPVILGGL